ncbi:hypothetical protein pdam_00020260 [Pocillopora damicornis]|uniref:Uncharacterized protein n=1 Tax=Pocillopora damicornis TaxID=46731 RepID=A0A3M6V0Y1_POCDA|nr:hypothetical protein pdam_00020260 [Pocillopora damicornis]
MTAREILKMHRSQNRAKHQIIRALEKIINYKTSNALQDLRANLDQNLLAFFYGVQTVGYCDDCGLLQFLPHYIPDRLLCVWVNMRSWLVQDDDFTLL